MKTSHTPGPWKTQWNGVWKVATRAGFLVANISPPKNAHGVFEPANVEANARLIAAAPELLASLIAIYEMVPFDVPESDPRVTTARELILKLTQP